MEIASSVDLRDRLVACRSREQYRALVRAARAAGIGLPRDLAGHQPALVLPPSWAEVVAAWPAGVPAWARAFEDDDPTAAPSGARR